MAITTYSELVAAVANWLTRDDLVERIPEFITLAEAKLNRGVRFFGMEKRSSISVDMSSGEPQYISVPSDFHSVIRMYLPDETGSPLIEYVEETRASEYASLYTATGRPVHFTAFGDELQLIPPPDEAYRIEMVYRSLIPALSDSNQTNWLLTIAPDAYLYGALLEAAPYMKDDERIQVWVAGLTAAIDGLNNIQPGKVPM